MEPLTDKQLHYADMATRLREDVIRMVSGAGSATWGPLDMAEIFTALYFIF